MYFPPSGAILLITYTIRWYTSMLGKKTSLRAILDELKKHQVGVELGNVNPKTPCRGWEI